MLRYGPRTLCVVAWLMLGSLARAWAVEPPPPASVGSVEYSASPERHGTAAAVETAQAHVTQARAKSDAGLLVEALTALGKAHFDRGEYVPAEAAYGEALQLAERRAGANSIGLFEPMSGLGATLAAEGRHAAAVPHLERALAIAHAGYGVFDVRQQELLRQLAVSLAAIGRIEDAEDRMLYSLRVAEKAYGAGNPEVALAICRAAEWFADIGKSDQARMAFKVALNIVEASLGEDDLATVEPLRGLANVSMREVSYPDSIRTPRNKGFYPVDSGGAPISKPRVLDPDGERALRRALQVVDAHPQAPDQLRIDTLIQMGDWYQIKRSPDEALPYYRRAARLMAEESPRLGESASLGFPLRVFYPTPSITMQNLSATSSDVQSHYVQVEFTVTAQGGVTEARVVDHDTTERIASQILGAVRAARYRPRFVQDQPVATSAMSYREVFAMRAPPQGNRPQ